MGLGRAWPGSFHAALTKRAVLKECWNCLTRLYLRPVQGEITPFLIFFEEA
jgi:hypothetical protein